MPVLRQAVDPQTTSETVQRSVAWVSLMGYTVVVQLSIKTRRHIVRILNVRKSDFELRYLKIVCGGSCIGLLCISIYLARTGRHSWISDVPCYNRPLSLQNGDSQLSTHTGKPRIMLMPLLLLNAVWTQWLKWNWLQYGVSILPGSRVYNSMLAIYSTANTLYRHVNIDFEVNFT